jgi:hypothetical protein
MSLPVGWHLNPANVPVPPPPQEGLELKEAMRLCINKFPARLYIDHAYHREDFWHEFFMWEHKAWRESTYHGEFSPAVGYKVLPSVTTPPPSPISPPRNSNSTDEDE